MSVYKNKTKYLVYFHSTVWLYLPEQASGRRFSKDRTTILSRPLHKGQQVLLQTIFQGHFLFLIPYLDNSLLTNSKPAEVSIQSC